MDDGEASAREYQTDAMLYSASRARPLGAQHSCLPCSRFVRPLRGER
jgi:hypothetical protein